MGVDRLGQMQNRGSCLALQVADSPGVQTIFRAGFPIEQLDDALANGPKLSKADRQAMSQIVHNLRTQSLINAAQTVITAV